MELLKINGKIPFKQKYKKLMIDQYRFNGGVPRDGLIGEWLFNGNANDTSGNSYNGSVSNAILTTNRKGISNSAYNFIKANGSKITIPNFANLSTFTICFWYKNSTLTNLGIISKSNLSSNFGDYSIFLSNLTTNGLSALLPPANSTLISYINPQDGLWHFGIGIYSSSYSRLYIDNNLVAYINSPSTITNNYSQLVIGQYYNNSYSYNGDLDDIRIYNRVLSADEITALYNE